MVGRSCYTQRYSDPVSNDTIDLCCDRCDQTGGTEHAEDCGEWLLAECPPTAVCSAVFRPRGHTNNDLDAVFTAVRAIACSDAQEP